MAFGRQMHHRIWAMLRENAVKRGAVTDIGLFEGIAGGIRHAFDIGQVRGIGQRIQIDDLVPGADRLAHHRRADEPCPPVTRIFIAYCPW